ncbi:hypothetical protein AB0L22_08915 [Micromonospora haikouensis]|uniref:hypothetical protein n=1 Tax=Micromonospora haikouensis TaxID=686309 RepID=UPI00342A7BA8
MSILDRIDATLDNLCPCGATPRPGSPYCGPDCEPTHISRDTDTRQSGHYATPMRWRPDLINEADDTNLTRVTAFGDQRGCYTGHHNASVYEYTNRPGWHLRLDDGHRYVGLDLSEEQVLTTSDLTALLRDMWARLERELGNTRHIEPNDDPWADVMGYPNRWRHLSAHTILRYCQRCNRHVTTRNGMRLTADHRPAAYLATAADISEHTNNLEPCQLCANCRKPFPGPPAYVALERDHWTPTIRIRMKAEGYERVETQLNVEDIPLDQLPAAIQQAADQLEALLFASPAARRQPPADAAMLRLLNAPIWTVDPQHIFRNPNVT